MTAPLKVVKAEAEMLLVKFNPIVIPEAPDVLYRALP